MSAIENVKAGPSVLIVRDGWGRNPNSDHDEFNAIKQANTPIGDDLLKQYPWTLIKTSGEDVGLPEGTMGNSEVGHQNIGAGRIVNQESVRITKAIRDGEFLENAAVKQAVEHAKNNRGQVHLFGIASDAGVHGKLGHLFGCLESLKKQGFAGDQVSLHLFTDGRDTGPFTGKDFLAEIEAKLTEIGVGVIASLCGRYYAMDRDNRWERVKMAYDLITGRAEVPNFESAQAAILDYYDNPTGGSQKGDEFVMPRTIGGSDFVAKSRVQSGDSVIFYNYRGDRPREITRAFMQPDFYGQVPASPDSGEKGFDRGEKLDLNYVCMTAYDESFAAFEGLSVAFPKPPKMSNIAGELISQKGLTQFRCAETEKFPHVTFFFNDYREEPFPGESRQMAQSPQVATYDLKPEMSAFEIRDIVLNRLASDDCENVFIINFANGDMVGHTGSMEAAIKAVETVDQCVGEIIEKVLEKSGRLIVTADHGNAEQMFDPNTGSPHTAHTTYDVDCVLVDAELKQLASGSENEMSTGLRSDGRLADVMPTLISMMGLEVPGDMSGASLIS